MEEEIDGLGKKKAVWIFCGQFPLREISEGKRACRKGWRNRGQENTDGWDMLAVIKSVSGDGPTLGLQRESAALIEGVETFNHIDDMLAEDWFLEQQT